METRNSGEWVNFSFQSKWKSSSGITCTFHSCIMLPGNELRFWKKLQRIWYGQRFAFASVHFKTVSSSIFHSILGQTCSFWIMRLSILQYECSTIFFSITKYIPEWMSLLYRGLCLRPKGVIEKPFYSWFRGYSLVQEYPLCHRVCLRVNNSNSENLWCLGLVISVFGAIRDQLDMITPGSPPG